MKTKDDLFWGMLIMKYKPNGKLLITKKQFIKEIEQYNLSKDEEEEWWLGLKTKIIKPEVLNDLIKLKIATNKLRNKK